jgi:hypothetical protein
VEQERLKEWDERRYEILTELIYEMSIAVGYNFDRVQIKRGFYIPIGHTELDAEMISIRKNLVEILNGNKSIPITVITPQVSGTERERQQKLAIGLDEFLDGKRPIPVKLSHDDSHT